MMKGFPLLFSKKVPKAGEQNTLLEANLQDLWTLKLLHSCLIALLTLILTNILSYINL